MKQKTTCFYHRHSELIGKYKISLKTLLQYGISELVFYGNLVYKFKEWLESLVEGLDGRVWYSLFIKNLAHYSSH